MRLFSYPKAPFFKSHSKHNLCTLYRISEFSSLACKTGVIFFAFFRRGWAGVERQTRANGEGAERMYRASRPTHFVLAFAGLKNAKR